MIIYRNQQLSLISEKFKVQLNTMKSRLQSKLDDEKMMLAENKSNQRMLQLIDLQAREERNEIIKKEYRNLEHEKKLFEDYKKASKINHQEQLKSLEKFRDLEIENQSDLINNNQMVNELRAMQFKHHIELVNDGRQNGKPSRFASFQFRIGQA